MFWEAAEPLHVSRLGSKFKLSSPDEIRVGVARNGRLGKPFYLLDFKPDAQGVNLRVEICHDSIVPSLIVAIIGAIVIGSTTHFLFSPLFLAIVFGLMLYIFPGYISKAERKIEDLLFAHFPKLTKVV